MWLNFPKKEFSLYENNVLLFFKPIIMKCILKLAIIFCFLLSPNLFSQDAFPKTWEGNYKGDLQIYGVDSVQMKLTMKLDIAQKSASIYHWKITYDLKGKEDIRDYELVIVDRKKGIYKIDEKNTIEIDSYYKYGTFTNFFQVSNSMIILSFTKENENLVFDLIAVDTKKTTSSGNDTFKGEEIPEVISYLVNGRQKAILKKVLLSSN